MSIKDPHLAKALDNLEKGYSLHPEQMRALQGEAKRLGRTLEDYIKLLKENVLKK